MDQKMKNRKKIKNYILLIIIFLVTILLVWYICKWYEVYSDYQKETPIIRGTLSYEITSVELDHYILENPNCMIYMCTSTDEVCRNFERDFKKLVEKDGLQNKIIYLNLSDANTSEFVDTFNKQYSYKVLLTEYFPAFVEFTDGKITGFIEGTEKEHLTVTKASQFIDLHHIEEEE